MGPLNCCVVSLQVPLTYEHEDQSSQHHDQGLQHICVNHSSQTPCQENQRQQSVCHHAQGNRHLTWKKAFFGPSPGISGQSHWEKLALSWSSGAHSCLKPSHEEQVWKVFHVHVRTWRQLSILTAKAGKFAEREQNSKYGQW